MSEDPEENRQPQINLADEVLTSIHKRENSRDNQYVDSTFGFDLNGGSVLSECLLQEPVVESTPDRGVAWEYHSIQLTRVPGYGFGIAVSGGRDNPHFANGDPAIAISDVLKSGPAEGKLLVNDRILSANGISLENVDYATAVQVLRDSGPSVQLVVKRRVILPQGENSTFKVTLSRKKRSDDFGIILGCKLYIKEVTNKIADKENTINEGDIVLKINSNSADGMTLKEAKKLIENSKEKLHLIVKRDNTICSNGFQLSSAATNVPQQQQQFKGNNYLELLDSRPSYSSQNLYVQPPTRDAGRMNRSVEEDKNNLIRMRRGPVGQEQQQLLYDPPPPRPPPPNDILPFPEQEVYSSSRRQLVFDQMEPQPQTATTSPQTQTHRVPSEPRFVTFVKEAGSVGIRLMGGNRTGIYVAAVQSQSPAAMQGIQPGDKILKVNDTELVNITREDAVLLLLNLQDAISMLVQFKPDEFEGVKQNGDSFYIKTHFNYEQPRKNETSFKRGEIFHVTDTLHNGTVGSYEAYRVSKSGQDGEKGVIPNKTHAEEFALKDVGKKEGNEVTKTGSFFRRRKPGSTRRSKSLNYEEIYSDAIKFPAYERVVLKHPAFVRPVVLFGPVADIARERLLRDYPEKFSVPSAAGDTTDSGAPRPIRLSGIKQIIEQNKHALIDVTPHGVERLIFAQLYPIVLFLKAESKQAVKEIRNGVINNKQQSSLSLLSRSPKRRPSTKKLFEDSLKLEKNYGHIITATLNLTDSWYRRIRDAIDREQAKMIWAANVKSPGNGGDPLNLLVEDDFFLFPSVTSPRYSYASSPESDVEAGELKDSSSPLVNKSTSDPSINAATQDDMGSVQLPNYNAPPPYSINMTGGQNGFFQDVFRITKKQRDYTPPPHQSLPQTNPPTLPKNSKLILTHSPPDSPVSHNPDFSPPPQIDRSKKPSGFGKSATERLFMDSYGTPSGESRSQDSHVSSPLRNGNSGLHENGNYDNGNYRWTPQHQQQSHVNGIMTDHDVYRYTRLTAQPLARESSPSKISYAMSNGNGTPRSTSDYKPPPPPSQRYRPAVPPKPAKLYSNYSTAPTTTNTENNYMNGKSPDPSLNDNHDSGHGSSLDRTIISSRNYSKYVYPSSRMTNTNSSNQPYYLNVPPPKNQTQQQQHQPIDLINREQRGSSAFELYRKPSELCPPPQHHQRVYRNTNSRGIFTVDSDGGTLEYCFSGVGSLLMIIPSGALPPNVKQEIYIKVVQGGGNDNMPIDNRKGEQMLTPMLEFGPPGLKFLRPVELRLSKPAGARQRTLKLKSSNESFWKEMDLDEQDDAGEVSTVFINQF